MWFLDQALPAFALVTSLLAAQPPLGGARVSPSWGNFLGNFCLKSYLRVAQLTFRDNKET